MITKPLHDYVLVREFTSDECKTGLIHLPQNFQDGQPIVRKGEVLATGPGRRAQRSGDLVPMAVGKGDQIFFVPMGGHQLNGYTIVNEANVIAKIS